MVQFIDLAAQQAVIHDGIERRIKAVLSHGQYIMGPEVSELEDRLARYANVKHAISCSSGTDALLMLLMGCGVAPGDVVFTTPFTFVATAEVIALLGAVPVFVDIDTRTFNLDPEKLILAIRAVKKKDRCTYPLPQPLAVERKNDTPELAPRGIVSVDLFGLPADYDRINSIAQEEGLFVLGDAAQSFGATYKGRKVGSLAYGTAISFFPAKPLGCYGDGGAVLTDDDQLALRIRSISLHGKGEEKYDNIRIGINGRLDTMQAAILLEKMEIFAEEIDARNRIAERYSRGLEGFLQVPSVPPGSISSWAQYSVLSNSRDLIRGALTKANIPTAVYYPRPLHLQVAFSYLGYNPGDFPVSERACQRIFSLPMHPYLKDEEVDRTIEFMKFYLSVQTHME